MSRRTKGVIAGLIGAASVPVTIVLIMLWLDRRASRRAAAMARVQGFLDRRRSRKQSKPKPDNVDRDSEG